MLLDPSSNDPHYRRAYDPVRHQPPRASDTDRLTVVEEQLRSRLGAIITNTIVDISFYFLHYLLVYPSSQSIFDRIRG